MKSETPILCVLLLAAAAPVFGQEERSAPPDTFEVEDRIGRIEESTDSPIVELLEPEAPAGHPVLEARLRFMQKLEASEGYRNGSYAGTRLKSYHRMKFRPLNGLAAGVLIEKDAGELRVDDFAAGHVALSGLGPLSMLVLGDYLIESGLGLALWRRAAVARGPDISGAVLRKGRGVVPYLSSDEQAFLRGAAASAVSGPVELSAFVSRRRLDASLDESGAATGLSAGGTFRTSTERSKRGNLTEDLVGASLRVRAGDGSEFGMVLVRSEFSRPIRLDGGDRFSGDHAALESLSYRFRVGNWTLFGEWGRATGAWGGSSGFTVKPAAGMEVVASVRQIPYRFVSFHGAGTGDRSAEGDERGLFAAVRISPIRRASLTCFAVLTRFPGGSGPGRFGSGEKERFLQLECRPADRCLLTLRYARGSSEEEEARTGSFGLRSTVPVERSRRSFRVNVDCTIQGGMRIRGRWEHVESSIDPAGSASNGAMALAELSAAPSAAVWWNLRLIIFRTDSYESRLYALERDLEGVTTMPVLYGSGIRWSCLVRSPRWSGIAISAKFSDHVRDDVRRIGSGDDRLPGNHDASFGLQCDLSF